MNTKLVNQALERVESWPAQAQNQLAEIALDIDAGLGDVPYEPSDAELEGIDRGLRDAAEERCNRSGYRGGVRQIQAPMKVVYTGAALKDLDEIADWLAAHYPAIAPTVERRIHNVVARIGCWPKSARHSAKRHGVRVVPVGR